MSKTGQRVQDLQEAAMCDSWTDDDYQRQSHPAPTATERHRAALERRHPEARAWAKENA